MHSLSLFIRRFTFATSQIQILKFRFRKKYYQVRFLQIENFFFFRSESEIKIYSSVKINYSLNNKKKRCLLTSLEFPNGNSYGRTYRMNESAQEIWYNSIMKGNFSPYLIYWSGTYPEILPDEHSVCVGQFLRVEFSRPISQTSNR